MCKIQDVPYLVKWMKENNVSREGQKQDYIDYMPVFIMQDGTPAGSKVLAKGELGAPMFWQKSPAHWCTPDNTLSRNCAGCHATGVTDKNSGLPRLQVRRHRLGLQRPEHNLRALPRAGFGAREVVREDADYLTEVSDRKGGQ